MTLAVCSMEQVENNQLERIPHAFLCYAKHVEQAMLDTASA